MDELEPHVAPATATTDFKNTDSNLKSYPKRFGRGGDEKIANDLCLFFFLFL